MILAIDASGATGVAVVDGDVVLLTLVDSRTRAHAEAIGPLMAEAVAAAGGPITAVAYGRGPGPFTGLRVGIAAARAFAHGRDLPVVPVGSHDAIAFDHLQRGGASPFVVVTDARRREVYSTEYSGADERGVPVVARGPLVGPDDDLPAMLRVDAAVDPGALGRLAERLGPRDDADGSPLYLRAPDVTPPKARV